MRTRPATPAVLQEGRHAPIRPTAIADLSRGSQDLRLSPGGPYWGERLAFSMFDQLAFGVVLIDSSARVLFANLAAQSFSKKGSSLRINSRIIAVSSAHARKLGNLVHCAHSDTLVRSMSLVSDDDGRSLLVLVVPMRGAKVEGPKTDGLCTAVAMLLICDPGRPMTVSAAWFMDAYGLTMAEARVALAIASGTTISEAARQLSISVNTIKTHLGRVYEKTGTRRQAELSRLIAMMSLVHAEDAGD